MTDTPTPSDIDSPAALRRAALNLLNASSPGRARIRDVHDRMVRAADIIDGLRDEVGELRDIIDQYGNTEGATHAS
jgi:hypothetical protein